MLKVLVFAADWCPTCAAWKRAGTVEKFAAQHPEVSVELVDLTDEGGVAEEAADVLNVKSIPAVRIVDGSEPRVTLASGSGPQTLVQLRDLLEKAAIKLARRKVKRA